MSEQRIITCPNCGANLSIDDDRDIFFCEYCGTKIRKESDHSYTKVEQEIRYIDEARLKEAELKIKELESENAPMSIKEFLKLMLCALLGIIVIPYAVGGKKKKTKTMRATGQKSRAGCCLRNIILHFWHPLIS